MKTIVDYLGYFSRKLFRRPTSRVLTVTDGKAAGISQTLLPCASLSPSVFAVDSAVAYSNTFGKTWRKPRESTLWTNLCCFFANSDLIEVMQSSKLQGRRNFLILSRQRTRNLNQIFSNVISGLCISTTVGSRNFIFL